PRCFRTGHQKSECRLDSSFFWRRLPLLANVSPTTTYSNSGEPMSTFGLIEYADASPEVRAVYDDIMATRKTDWINNFWKAIAHDPATLKRTWESIKQIMAPGALDPLTKDNDLRRGQRNQPVRLLHRVAHRGSAEERDERRHVPGADGGGRNGERNQPPRRRVSSRDRRAVQEMILSPVFNRGKRIECLSGDDLH